MTTPNSQELMYLVISRKEEINRLTERAIGVEYPVFQNLSIPMPKLNPAELGFILVVSWLYVLYVEAGKVGVAFLADRFSAFQLDPQNNLVEHYRIIQQFRTYHQHNLDLQISHDQGIREICERWLLEKCGTPLPGDEAQWNECLVSLLSEALEFLDALYQCIRKIENDESRQMIVRDWIFKFQRYHPPHEFDTLIAKVASDMGRDLIDQVRMRKRHYDKWTKDLIQLHGEYEFGVEARKLIEQTFLTETTTVLPITGDDLMATFGIPPGPQLGKLLERANTLYLSQPCSGELLLQRLMEEENRSDDAKSS